MSRKARKALRDEVNSYSYDKPLKGCKVYALTYGKEIMYTFEAESYYGMNKAFALNIINDLREEEHLPPLTNIKKVNYFRVA